MLSARSEACRDGGRQSFDLAGQTLKVAMVNGLGNARKLLKKQKKGKVSYDFVEVMGMSRRTA